MSQTVDIMLDVENSWNKAMNLFQEELKKLNIQPMYFIGSFSALEGKENLISHRLVKNFSSKQTESVEIFRLVSIKMLLSIAEALIKKLDEKDKSFIQEIDETKADSIGGPVIE